MLKNKAQIARESIKTTLEFPGPLSGPWTRGVDPGGGGGGGGDSRPPNENMGGGGNISICPPPPQ